MKKNRKYIIPIAVILLLIIASVISYCFLRPNRDEISQFFDTPKRPFYLPSNDRATAEQIYFPDSPCKNSDSAEFKNGIYSFCSQILNLPETICGNPSAEGNYVISNNIKFDSSLSPKNSISDTVSPFKIINFQNGFSYYNIKDTANTENVGWYNCRIESKSVSLEQLNVNGFNFINCDFTTLELEHDSLISFNVTNSYISIARLTNSVIANTSINSSKIDSLNIDSSKCDASSINFSYDTLSNIFISNISSADIRFNNCIFSEDINIKLGENCNLIFDDCTFSGSFRVTNITVGNLYFNNCKNFENPFDLITDSGSLTKITFDNNTDLSKVIFDYDEKYELIYNRYKSDDENKKLYDHIVTKFKSEYKSVSLERVQIEFTSYNYSKNLLKYPLWFIDWGWWNYGFSKNRVLVWTLLFIGLFFLYNAHCWEKMSRAYNIFPHFKERNKNRSKKYFYVFLFTVFIFFSLRVDLQNLKYDDKESLRWFFIQYFIGLICLFFLFNAIFTLT